MYRHLPGISSTGMVCGPKCSETVKTKAGENEENNSLYS
jgi:hypothetical protein